MNEKQSKRSPRNQLEQELEHDGITFTTGMKKFVISKARKRSFWDREIVIHKSVAAAVLMLLIAAPILSWQLLLSETDRRQSAQVTEIKKGDPELVTERDRLIVSAGGVFFESQLREGWPQSR